MIAKIGELDFKNSGEEKLLGIKIGSKLFFENHVSSLCEKASQKLDHSHKKRKDSLEIRAACS